MKNESLIITLVLGVLLWFTVWGVFLFFWDAPAKRAEIAILQAENVELQKSNNDLKTALRFENLFLLTANQNDLLDFTELEDYLCEKRGLCK